MNLLINSKHPRLQRFFLLSAVFHFCLLLTACSSDWVSQAVAIVGVLEPAVMAALSILAAFGLGLSPDVLTKIQAWAQQIQSDLTNVIKPLIDQYNQAAADAKPGLLAEIQTALQVVQTNMSNILAAAHVADPAKQAKINAILGAIQAEITALVNLVPVLQGKVTDTHEQIKAVHALKSAEKFKHDFNNLVHQEFGDVKSDQLIP